MKYSIILLALVFTNLTSARQECSTSSLVQQINSNACNITQLWLPDVKDVSQTLSRFVDYGDTLLIGCTALLAWPIIQYERLDPSETFHDPFFSGLADFAFEMTVAALPTAIEDYCQQRKKFNLHFIIVYLRDTCSAADLLIMIQLLEAGIDIIFGTPCSASGALLSSYYLNWYNIPLFLTTSIHIDKDEHKTLVHMGPSSRFVGDAFVELCKKYNWNTVSIIHFNEGICLNGALIKDVIAGQADMTVATYALTTDRTTEKQLSQHLKNAKESSRVIITCYYTTALQNFMKLAVEQGMTTHEFVFLVFQAAPTTGTFQPWGSTEGLTQSAIDELKAPFKNVKMLTNEGSSEKNKDLQTKIKNRIVGPPWNFTYVTDVTDFPYNGSNYALYLYDSVWMYLKLLHEIVDSGLNIRNGTLFFHKSRNRSFEGRSGDVLMGDNGGRLPSYWLFQLKPQRNQFSQYLDINVVQSSAGLELKLLEVEKEYWGTVDGQPPPNEPRCGYRGRKCLSVLQIILLGVLCTIVPVGIVAYLCVKRHRTKKRELESRNWRLEWSDIVPVEQNAAELSHFTKALGSGRKKSRTARSDKSKSSAGSNSLGSGSSGSNNYNVDSDGSLKTTSAKTLLLRRMSQFSSVMQEQQFFAELVFYKDKLCAMKQIKKTDCTLSIGDIKNLKQVRELKHQNVNTFVGVCTATPHMYVLTEYCTKGCLQDVLENEQIQLDWVFKLSLMFDLACGLVYIHESPLVSHGSLKSTKCLIDNQWVLKIHGTGLRFLSHVNATQVQKDDYQMYRDQLWTAPELLRANMNKKYWMSGTQSADIYSMAIIMQEIVFRDSPYFLESESPKEIVEKVKADVYPPFRPKLPAVDENGSIDPKMIRIIEQCWQESPTERPGIRKVKHWLSSLFQISVFVRTAINADRRIEKLERYVNNLELIINKRTKELSEKKERCDNLMCSMIPRKITELLQEDFKKTLDNFDNVTVCISYMDINEKYLHSKPGEMMDFLTSFFTIYDEVLKRYDVCKLKTTDDSYMAVSGCPIRNGHKHASEIANMTLQFRKSVRNYLPMQNVPLKIKTGIHSGPCAAGVVGINLPTYCLFGNIVPIASEIASRSGDMKINMSSSVFNILRKTFHDGEITPGESTEIKGLGNCKTYWLDD